MLSVEDDSPPTGWVFVSSFETMQRMVARHLETDTAAHGPSSKIAAVGFRRGASEEFSARLSVHFTSSPHVFSPK